MRLKDETVSVKGLHEVFWSKLFILDQIWREELGYELVITSAKDGKHMDGSKHYDGEAIDMRTRKKEFEASQIGSTLRNRLYTKVAGTLGDQFEVIDEDDHFHIEYVGGNT